MGTVASDLKAEREKRKISLAQIAAETRISLRYLESLEEGRFSDLPGGMYNRAFLKCYCDFLNLDCSDIMQRYEAEISPVLEKPLKSKVHIPQQSPSFRISPPLIWGLLLLLSAAGIFFSRKWITIFSPYFSHAPVANVRYEPVQPTPAAPKLPEPPPVASTPTPTPTPEPEQAQTQTSESTGPLPIPAAPQPATASTPAAEPGAVPNAAPPPLPAGAGKPLRMEIKATDKCWISVNRDGVPAFRKLMEPGEVQSFSASEKFEVILGNAGGVHLTLNGKPARALGKPGEVVKVLIDEKSLKDIQEHTAG